MCVNWFRYSNARPRFTTHPMITLQNITLYQGATPLWTGRAGWSDELNTGVLTDILKLPTDVYLPTEQEVRASRQ